MLVVTVTRLPPWDVQCPRSPSLIASQDFGASKNPTVPYDSLFLDPAATETAVSSIGRQQSQSSIVSETVNEQPEAMVLRPHFVETLRKQFLHEMEDFMFQVPRNWQDGN